MYGSITCFFSLNTLLPSENVNRKNYVTVFNGSVVVLSLYESSIYLTNPLSLNFQAILNF